MYSIMIWNTQHFDNQRGKLSSAYSDKKQFLDYFIQQKKPDMNGTYLTANRLS